MKKYLWTMTLISVLTPSIYADENPFVLQENFQKIDKEMDAWIEGLKKIYNETNIQKETDKAPKIVIEEPLVEQNVSTIEDNKTDSNQTDMNISKTKKTIDDENAIDTNKTEEKPEETNDTISAKDGTSKKEIVEIKPLFQENKEVKETTQTDSKKNLNLKVVEINSTQEEQEADQASEEAFLRAVQEVEKDNVFEIDGDGKVVTKENNKDVKKKQSEDIVDINLGKEEIEALKKADEAFLQAIKEVE